MPACTRPNAGAHDPSWDVDRYVGARLRTRRLALGMTQQQMAELIGVTYQQAQKYEAGANRMTAQRLFTAAAALGVAVDYFFEPFEAERPPLSPSQAGAEQAAGELSRILAAILQDHPKALDAALLAIGDRGTFAISLTAEGRASPGWPMAPQAGGAVLSGHRAVARQGKAGSRSR